jgi:hypothetical protein
MARPLDMTISPTSLSLAMSFSGAFNPDSPPMPPKRSSSLLGVFDRRLEIAAQKNLGPSRPQSAVNSRPKPEKSVLERPKSTCVSLYKGVSDRPLGWKPRKLVTTAARGLGLKRWDGMERNCNDWDALRKVC